MGYWGYKIVDGDEPCDRLDDILEASQARFSDKKASVAREIRIVLGTELPLPAKLKNQLEKYYHPEEVLSNLFESFKSREDYFGDAKKELFQAMHIFYAVTKKIIPEYKNTLVLCATNLSIIQYFKESPTFNEYEARFLEIVKFNNSIGNSPINISGEEVYNIFAGESSLNLFLDKFKTDIFLNNFTSGEWMDVKNSLLEISSSEWDFPFKNDLLIEIEKEYLASSFPPIPQGVSKKHKI